MPNSNPVRLAFGGADEPPTFGAEEDIKSASRIEGK